MVYVPDLSSFESLSTKEKMLLLRQLDSVPDEQARTVLEKAIGDRTAKVRHLALTILARRFKAPRSLVIQMLDDRAKMVQQKALKLLQQWPDPDLIPRVTPFLTADDLGLRLLAIDWFFLIGPAAIPVLEPLTRDPMFSVREKVRHCLRDLRRQTQRPQPLLELPAEKTEDTRSAMGALRREWRRLFEDLRNEPEEVWVDQLKQILTYGKEEAIQYCVHAIDDARWSWREALIEALKALPDCPTSFFHPLLDHPLWYVRAAAVQILGHHRDPALLDAALRLSRDSNIEVRRALAEVLVHYDRQEEALLALEKLSHDEHFYVRRLARETLETLRIRKNEKVPEG